MSEHFSVRMTLLDAQIVDRDRLPIGRVDDLELALDGDESEIESILTGSQALGDRIGGIFGRRMSSVSARLRSGSKARTPALPASLIVELTPLVKLDAEFDDLCSVAGLEHWLAANLVERLPGTGHADK
jgi:hypothetical protein